MLIDGGPEGFIKSSKTACEYFNLNCKEEEDMDKCITAKWAKAESEKVLGEKVQKELGKCEVAIRQAVRENKFETTLYFYPHDLTVHVLTENRGFKVNCKHGGQMGNDSIKISWK